MGILTRFYRYLSILSIDVALGAVCCALFFSVVFEVRILVYGLLALGLSVWIIYTLDHLRDSKVIGEHAVSLRHQFHRRHFKILTTILVLALLVDFLAIINMREAVFKYGILLSIIVVIYLISQHYLKFLKEFFVAVLYTSGVVLPSLAVTKMPEVSNVMLMVQLFLVAWTNLLAFSSFDVSMDMQQRQVSFATLFGSNKTSMVIQFLSAVHLVVAIVMIMYSNNAEASAMLMIMQTLLLLLFATYRSSRNEISRWLGDAVFFIPFIYWLWHHR